MTELTSVFLALSAICWIVILIVEIDMRRTGRK